MERIEQIQEGKKRFLDLLLLADEQEDMIDRYLEPGELFVLYEADTPRCVAVVLDLGEGECELKNIATDPMAQRRGFGRRMVDFLAGHYRGRCRTMYVGTGDVPSTTGFYRQCGFVPSHRVENFFTDHYRKPIFEEGIQLVDMVYFRRALD